MESFLYKLQPSMCRPILWRLFPGNTRPVRLGAGSLILKAAESMLDISLRSDPKASQRESFG